MGGTTAKAALIDAGQYLRVNSLEVGGGINIAGRLLSGGGYHVRAPAIDIAEVGAGGGSMARIDAGGALRVGPESAGAAPGPVCYGRGGTVPTVTDANVILGFINPTSLAGGGLPIQRELAVESLRSEIAAPLNLRLDDAAWGVHRVANAMMARALRAVSTERGRDPRELAMLAFGGNGPVHAATLARLLDIRRILVPPVPGLFSALGMLFPEIEHHYVRTYKRRLRALDKTELEQVYQGLEAEGAMALLGEGFGRDEHRFERLVDLRYAGANSELTLPFPAHTLRRRLCTGVLSRAQRQYGYSSAEGRSDDGACHRARFTQAARVPHRVSFDDRTGRGGTRFVYFGPDVGSLATPICARSDLNGNWRSGPLLVEEFDSTTVVPPDGRARCVAWDTIEIELE
jgi:N-methylhydantoinase A